MHSVLVHFLARFDQCQELKEHGKYLQEIRKKSFICLYTKSGLRLSDNYCKLFYFKENLFVIAKLAVPQNRGLNGLMSWQD